MSTHREPPPQCNGSDRASPVGITPLGPEYLTAMQAALIGLFDGVATLRGELTDEAVPGSPAAEEFMLSKRKKSLGTARSIASILIESGGEHLTLFVQSVCPPAKPIACCTCIRSLVESCAFASWILDPSIEGTTRVRRVLAYKRDGLNQQLGFSQGARQASEMLRTIENQIARLDSAASELGVPQPKGRKRRPGEGRVKMPTATRVVGAMLDEEVSYRLLSAVVHGHEWAIRELGFTKEARPSEPLTSDSIFVARIRKTLKMDVVALLGLIAAQAFCRPVWYQFNYEGWDREPLRELFESAFDRMGAAKALRFWE